MVLLRIQLLDQKFVYFPGETISGNVYIHSNDPLTANSVKITLNGIARTDWTETEQIVVPALQNVSLTESQVSLTQQNLQSQGNSQNLQSQQSQTSSGIVLGDRKIGGKKLGDNGIGPGTGKYKVWGNPGPGIGNNQMGQKFDDYLEKSGESGGQNLEKEKSGTSEQAFVSETIPYWSEITYTNQEQCIWSSSPQQENLPSGETRLPFSFQLPQNLPPTFEGNHGRIRYSLKALIERPPTHKNVEHESAFSVTPNFDLNVVPNSDRPNVKGTSNNLGFIFKHGNLDVKVVVSKIGYVPGEQMDLTVFIDNKSTRDVHKVKFELQQVATYKADRHHSPHLYNHSSTHPNTETNETVRTVIESKEEFLVKKHSIGKYHKSVVIPSVAPSFNSCPIIHVGYVLSVSVVAKGTVNHEVTCQLPVLIGTIPIRGVVNGDEGLEHSLDLEPPKPSAIFELVKSADTLAKLGRGLPSLVPTFDQLTYEDDIFGKSDKIEGQEKGDQNGYVPKYVYYKNK